jgi:hypothetical protein
MLPQAIGLYSTTSPYIAMHRQQPYHNWTHLDILYIPLWTLKPGKDRDPLPLAITSTGDIVPDRVTGRTANINVVLTVVKTSSTTGSDVRRRRPGGKKRIRESETRGTRSKARGRGCRSWMMMNPRTNGSKRI